MSILEFPSLNNALSLQLVDVGKTNGLYYPCLVELVSGQKLDCVYLAEATEWYRRWGVWPTEDRGKKSVSLKDVRGLESSPSRLLAEYADKLYQAGESGMGYTIFTVVFRDGSSQAFSAGNAIDFIEYPIGQSASTVVEVLPHFGRNDPRISKVRDYFWCLYSNT